LRDAEAVGVGGVMFPQRMPRREVFNLAGPSSFGSYMKMLASISNKYHRQQSCSSPESLQCARRDHPMRLYRCIDRARHRICEPDECLYQTPVESAQTVSRP
jgi:hypothetical protein